MNISIYSAADSFGGSRIFLKAVTSFQFNRIIVEFIPYNLRYNKATDSVSTSDLRTEVEIELDSSLIREMQTLQLKSPEHFIAEFNFKFLIQAFNDRKKLHNSECWINILSPWTNAADAENYPYGKTLQFKEITENLLPSANLQMQLENSFNEEDLQAAYASTDELNIKLKSDKNLQNIKITCETEGQGIASERLENLTTGQVQHLRLKLPENLAHLFKISQQKAFRTDSEFYTLNLIVDSEIEGERNQDVSTFLLENPVYKELAKINRRIAVQLKTVLNENYPDCKHEIDEQDDWFRFQIGGHNFQYGLKDNSIHTYIHFSKISYDINFKILKSQMAVLNKELKHKLKEIDNYFVLEAKIKLDKLNDQNLIKLLNELLDIANNPNIKSFMVPYERV